MAINRKLDPVLNGLKNTQARLASAEGTLDKLAGAAWTLGLKELRNELKALADEMRDMHDDLSVLREQVCKAG